MRHLALLALLVALPASAQAPGGTHDVARIAPGSYEVEPEHTQIRFGVLHLGFNPYYGVFSRASGTLALNPQAPAQATVSVTIPVVSVATTSAKLDEELKGADWFDAARFPTITFKSQSVAVDGTDARIAGLLTLHGVTRPVVLQAHFVGAGTSPMGGAQMVGFTATGTLKRSDFGVTKYAGLLGDDVSIEITAAFQKSAFAKSPGH